MISNEERSDLLVQASIPSVNKGSDSRDVDARKRLTRIQVFCRVLCITMIIIVFYLLFNFFEGTSYVDRQLTFMDILEKEFETDKQIPFQVARHIGPKCTHCGAPEHSLFKSRVAFDTLMGIPEGISEKDTRLY